MHSKQVRRRRAVLALLVAISLILLTATFGGSGGPLHIVQQGTLEVLSPIQEGASRALKPVSDLAGWVGDTFRAKKDRDQLRKQVATLRRQVVGYRSAVSENQSLRKMVGLDSKGGLDGYKPVTGRVIGRSPNLWYRTLEIDQGSGAGVREGQPVVDGDGLVGKITHVTPGTAKVTLITDHTSGVSAKVLGPDDPGVVVPAVGAPGDLLLQYLPAHSKVEVGQSVVTAGTASGKLESLFPPDIPIGQVTKVSPDELSRSQQVHLSPAVDLRRVDFVQVLTRPNNGELAQVGP